MASLFEKHTSVFETRQTVTIEEIEQKYANELAIEMDDDDDASDDAECEESENEHVGGEEKLASVPNPVEGGSASKPQEPPTVMDFRA